MGLLQKNILKTLTHIALKGFVQKHILKTFKFPINMYCENESFFAPLRIELYYYSNDEYACVLHYSQGSNEDVPRQRCQLCELVKTWKYRFCFRVLRKELGNFTGFIIWIYFTEFIIVYWKKKKTIFLFLSSFQ